jgi:hypothetical protein
MGSMTAAQDLQQFVGRIEKVLDRLQGSRLPVALYLLRFPAVAPERLVEALAPYGEAGVIEDGGLAFFYFGPGAENALGGRLPPWLGRRLADSLISSGNGVAGLQIAAVQGRSDSFCGPEMMAKLYAAGPRSSPEHRSAA